MVYHFDDMCYRLQVGDTVRRGPDWTYGSQDGSPPGVGTVASVDKSNRTVTINWAHNE